MAVENTTEQLPALKKAGVVDAGGYGLLVLFRGLARGIVELHARRHRHLAARGRAARRARGRRPGRRRPRASELSAYRYCTSLLITGEGIDTAAFEAFLRPSATARSWSATQRMVKVHVHTNDPGVVLSEALALGSIGEVEINDMHEQTSARDERLQERPAESHGRHGRRRRRRRRGQQGALPRARLRRRSSTAASP